MDLEDIQLNILSFCAVNDLIKTRLVCKSMNKISDDFIVEKLADKSLKAKGFCGRNSKFLICSSDEEYYYYDFFHRNWDFDDPALRHYARYTIDENGIINVVNYEDDGFMWVSTNEWEIDAAMDYLEIDYYDWVILDGKAIKFSIEKKCRKYGFGKFIFPERITDRVDESLLELPEPVFDEYKNQIQ